ncbi:MAG: tetratricopeptide repeat protein [Deltaproteobacteria bacterium]|nr:tetratricopeptide repeat protein [Deltaproteobacteria bacterium]
MIKRPLKTAAFSRVAVWLLLAVLLVSAGGLAGCSSREKQEEASLSALHFFQLGNQAYQDHDFVRAAGHYRRALNHDPISADIHYNLGLAYYQGGAYDEAVKSLLQAVRLDPEFADAHMNLALAFDRVFDRSASHHHYNIYLRLTTAGEAASAQTGALATPAAALDPAAQQAAQQKAALPPFLKKTAPRTTGQARPGKSRQAKPRTGGTAPAGGGKSSNQNQSQEKWWTQEQYLPNQ